MSAGRVRWFAATAAIVAATIAAQAIERTKIPAFAIADREGRGRSSESLRRSGSWLLVVVHPECSPCESMLRAVAELPADIAASRLVIVVGGGSAADVPSTIARFPELATAEWFTAASNDVIQSLKLPAPAALFGARGNMIEWSVSGVLTDPRDLRSVAASWLAGITP